MTLADTERPHTVSTPWVRICALADLEVERGRAALLGDEQLALFLTHEGRVYAVSNLDPYSGAHVISRGITGSIAGRAVVTSPMLKHRFDLVTGASLDDPAIALPVFTTRVHDGWVEIGPRVAADSGLARI